MINTVDRNSFTKVRLETVHTHIQQHFQLILEPLTGIRIGKVHKRHTGLPHIPLPYIAVCSLNKVTFFLTFFK